MSIDLPFLGNQGATQTWDMPVVQHQMPCGSDPPAMPATSARLSPNDGETQPSRELKETVGSEARATDTLTQSIVWLLLLTVFQKGFGAVRSILLCRWLDPIALGTWGIAQPLMDSAVPLLLLSIPGGFGRYIETFRQRRQLKGFVRWTVLVSGTSLVLGCCLGYLWRDTIARLVFGSEQYSWLAGACCFAVVPAACFAFLAELLVGLRLGTLASRGHFLRGLLFTGISLGLVYGWARSPGVLVAAYGISFAVAAVFVMCHVSFYLSRDPADETPFQARPVLHRLAPVLAGFCLVDLLNNLFTTVDRYMLIHLLPVSPEECLSAVGNYESAAVMPVLLVMTGTMIARMVLPHQIYSWEQGDRERAQRLMHHLLQGLGGLSIVSSWLLLNVGGTVFSTVFRNQYASGQQILPMVAAFHTWMSLSAVLVNYFWCVERTGWSAVAMALGLVVNILGNLWLIPLWGIEGAATATLVANVAQWILLSGMAYLLGLRMEKCTIALAVLPLGLCISEKFSLLSAILGLGLSVRACIRSCRGAVSLRQP